MLLDAGRDGQDVRIEDYVVWGYAHLFDQDLERALTDAHFVLSGRGLSLFIERHDHHGSAIPSDGAGLLFKSLLALFKADRIHDRLSLNALEPGL